MRLASHHEDAQRMAHLGIAGALRALSAPRDHAASARPSQPPPDDRAAPNATWRVIEGDCRDVLPSLPAQSVHCVVTSPPYFSLRDYGVDGQIGLESTVNEYVAELVGVFGEVHRVLRDDGTAWINLGDSWSGKQLLGAPWRFAFAMQAAGWLLRCDCIWSKPSPLPESATDRPTKSHEYLFLLAKSPSYFFDAQAIREESTPDMKRRAAMGHTRGNGTRDPGRNDADSLVGGVVEANGHNKRSVWTVGTEAFPGEHFAVMPTQLAEPCILASAPEGGLVLDPFCGAGTTGVVALRHGRSFVGIELSPRYARMARERILWDAPLLNIGSEITEGSAA
jgi:site-specific DNA-methyltransferase (adenine-specific)